MPFKLHSVNNYLKIFLPAGITCWLFFLRHGRSLAGISPEYIKAMEYVHLNSKVHHKVKSERSRKQTFSPADSLLCTCFFTLKGILF
jgi:hypothetical protein